MPNEDVFLTAAHVAYIAERTAGDDDFLRELKAAARAAGLPEIWVAPAQATFMQIVLRIAGAREVVEVGTLAGSTAIALARALPDGGRVRTIEIDPGHAAFARSWIARSDVAERIDVLEGDARAVLETIPDASVDVVFIDADKAGYEAYLRSAERILRPAGVVLVDNALAFGRLLDADAAACDADVPHLRAFNDTMAATASFDSVIVPLGDGCWLGVRR